MSDLRKEMQTLADRINVSYLLTANCGGPTERNLTQREFDLILIALRMAGVAQASREHDDEDHMQKISALIARLQSTMDQFGDTCVYIRRGGLAWGAVALNRRDDDKKHGVFDLQAQHDRDILQRVEQVARLIASKNEWMERAAKAEAALSSVSSTSRGGT